MTLIRIGRQWGVVWRDPGAPAATRWRGRIVRSVEADPVAETFGVHRAVVWWTADCSAARREEIGAMLRAEADHA